MVNIVLLIIDLECVNRCPSLFVAMSFMFLMLCLDCACYTVCCHAAIRSDLHVRVSVSYACDSGRTFQCCDDGQPMANGRWQAST